MNDTDSGRSDLSIEVTYTSAEASLRAGQLAARLHTQALPAQCQSDRRQSTHPCLVVDERQTTLEWGGPPPTRLQLSFIGGKNRYRADNSRRREETLARALGIGKRLSARQLSQWTVLDATSGLGRDAWAIASYGCSVIAMERCTWLQWMQREALQEALAHPATIDCASRLTLVHADAGLWLAQGYASRAISAIYLDPMYPARAKSAAVKKDMQALQQLIGKDQDSKELLTHALDAAHNSAIDRVVVKRPRGAEPLENTKNIAPHHQHESRKTRYDVYQTGK